MTASAECRKYGANMLMNVGPMGDGTLHLIDTASLGIMGEWVGRFNEAIRAPRPCNIVIENKKQDFILKDSNCYYLFCFDLPIEVNANVIITNNVELEDRFELADRITAVTWMDNGDTLAFTQEKDKVTVYTKAQGYGRNLVVRVAKIQCE